MNILNYKKITNEMVKKDKFVAWQVADYDKLTSLVMFDLHSIYRVFKKDFLLIKENERGIKKETLKKIFNVNLSEYKKAEVIEIKKMQGQTNKKNYTCLDNEVWINNDRLKYIDKKQKYQFWYKSKKEPIFITTVDNFKVALICPVNIK